MTDFGHLIVQAKKWFGRVDYAPLNDVARCHLVKGANTIPADKIAELQTAGYRVEII